MKTPFAQCKIRSLSLLRDTSKLPRHVESAQHERALEQWHRARAPKALPTAGLTATKEAINGEASPKAGLTADAQGRGGSRGGAIAGAMASKAHALRY